MQVINHFLVIFTLLTSYLVYSELIDQDTVISLLTLKVSDRQNQQIGRPARLLSVDNTHTVMEHPKISRSDESQYSFLQELLMKMMHEHQNQDQHHNQTQSSTAHTHTPPQNKTKAEQKQASTAVSKGINSTQITQTITQIKQIQRYNNQSTPLNKTAAIMSQLLSMSNEIKDQNDRQAISVKNEQLVHSAISGATLRQHQSTNSQNMHNVQRTQTNVVNTPLHLQTDQSTLKNQSTLKDDLPAQNNTRSVNSNPQTHPPSATTSPTSNLQQNQASHTAPITEPASPNQYLLMAVIALSILVIILSSFLACCHLKYKTRIKNIKTNDQLPQQPIPSNQRLARCVK